MVWTHPTTGAKVSHASPRTQLLLNQYWNAGPGAGNGENSAPETKPAPAKAATAKPAKAVSKPAAKKAAINEPGNDEGRRGATRSPFAGLGN